MNTVCHPLPPQVAHEMLQLLAQSLCVRPGEGLETRESRTRQMVHSVRGFEPRDGLEYMLSGMVFGHFHLILDSIRDALRGEMDTVKAKTKTTVVALDRSMLNLVKEFRISRHRPLSPAAMAEQAQQAAAEDEADSTDWVAEWAGVPNVADVAEPETVDEPEPVPEEAEPAAANSAAAARQVQTSSKDDDVVTQQHIEAFQGAMAAMAETLTEARAPDGAPPDPKVISGD